MEEKSIRKKLYELRKTGREDYMRLAGINVEKVRATEKKIDAQYEEIARELKSSLKEAGKETAEMHANSFKRAHARFLETTQMQLEKAELGYVYPAVIPDKYVFPLCWCSYPNVATPVAPPEDTVDLDGGGASGSVTYNAGANIAHPIADAHGLGTGTINTAKVTTSFRFAFNPTSNGTYCIYPLVYMNGHWLVWTWGTCGGTAEDLGSGEVKVTVRIKVTQLDQKLKEREHVVIHKNVSAGQDQQSGFAYDSDVDGGTATTVYLQGGYTAVVWVECECFAQISNHGRAWVDMQSSPSFYFKAGQIRWGWRICYPWWITKVKLIE